MAILQMETAPADIQTNPEIKGLSLDAVSLSKSPDLPPLQPQQSYLNWILTLPSYGFDEIYRIFIGGGEVWREKNFSLAFESMEGIEGNDWLETTQRLRERLTASPEAPELIAVCRRRIAGNNHFSFHDSLLTCIIGEDFEKLPLQEQFERIEAAPAKIKERRISVWTGNALGASGLNFDPHLYNIPSTSYRINGIPNIRMATPTRKGLRGRTEAIPEMAGYLRGIEKPHLYINLQSLVEGAEFSRSRAIRTLEGQQFCFLSLDHDSPFYHQRETEAELDVNTFEQEFVEHLRGPHCSLPDEIEERIEIRSAIQILCPENELLSQEQRKNIILLTYALLSLRAMLISDCESFNITCKDGIDRAAVLNALFFQLILIFTGRENETKMQRALLVLLHAPAFLVKSQAVLPTRRDRLLLIWDLIRSPEVTERLRAFGKDFHFNIEIPENPSQEVVF